MFVLYDRGELMVIRVGELLVDRELISRGQLRAALETQQRMGGRLGTNLIELGFVDPDDLGLILGELFRLTPVPWRSLQSISEQIVQILPVALATRHQALPFALDDTGLHVATTAPRNLSGLSGLIGRRIRPWITPELPLVKGLAGHYGLRVPRRYVPLST